MKIRITKVIEDKFNLKQEMKKRKLSCRALGKLTGIHFTQIHKITNGMICSEEVARKIKNKLL